MTATLDRYMTRHPHSIRIDEKLETAAKMMEKHGIRHLPVLDGGELKGVISDRDVRLARANERPQLKVSDVFIEEPFAIDVDTSMFVVAEAMAEKKIGSAIVLEQGKVVGIFTAVDACRALADTLRPRT